MPFMSDREMNLAYKMVDSPVGRLKLVQVARGLSRDRYSKMRGSGISTWTLGSGFCS